MLKHIVTILAILLFIIAASRCASSPGSDSTVSSSSPSSDSTVSSEGITLHETPQTYELAGGDSFKTMPSVTLYENGNARLSQPLISSFALVGMGHYQVSGDELTVSYDEDISAVFSISDGGDTLTLKSSSLAFTSIGADYQYRSKSDFLSKYSKVEGEKLTLALLRELAQEGASLTIADFEKYARVAIDPDHLVFDIEGEYTLTVICAVGNTSCTVERNSSGESFPLDLNGSTGLVFDEFLGLTSIPEYEAREWLDFLYDEKLPWGDSRDLTLPEFPGVTFTWTPEKITADGKELIFGMPVWNVYLDDLTNDGKPEICATVSIGSGIADTRVVVYDYVEDKTYVLVDRMTYDYYLSMQDGKLIVTQTGYRDRKPLASAELRLIKGEIAGF